MNAAQQNQTSHQSTTLNPEKRVDSLIKLADYHRKAMEARRRVCFEGFIAVFGLNSAVLFKFEKLAHLFSNNLLFTWIITLVCVLALLAFLHVIWEVEKRNEGDRQRFVILESEAWKLLDHLGWKEFYGDLAIRGRVAKKRSARVFLSGAWGSSGLAIYAFAFTSAIVYYLWAFKV